MSDTIQKLLDRRANCVEQMREVAEAAVDEGRDMTADETRQYREWNAEVDALQERADAMLEGEKKAKEQADSLAELRGKPKERNTPDESRQSDEIRAWMRGEGNRAYVVPAGPLEARDVTTTSGAGSVPQGFRSQLWESMIETAGVLNAGVDLLQTDSGETIKLPRVTAHSEAAAATEGQAITEDDPTLSSVNSTVTKEGYVVQLTRELLDDTGVDIDGYLARAAGRELGNRVGAAAVTAALAAATAGATGPAGATPSFGLQSAAGAGFDLVITLFHSVLAPYRNSSSCSWLMSDVTAGAVRKIKDADGRYAWQPAVTVGAPDTILGKPVYIDTNVPDPAVSSESILFGDWRSLVVRMAGGFRFERSDDFAFDTDMVTYRALVRHGSVSVDANALKSFTYGAAA